MRSGARPVGRDLLELMIAYGFVPEALAPEAAPAAPIHEAPRPRRSPGHAPLRLALTAGSHAPGCTVLAIGLARAWARAGRSVLLVDLDTADPLGRLLLLGSALSVNTGQLLLRAVADGGVVEPSRTLLPGVDVVANSLGADPEELPRLLRARPTALRAALAPWLDRYDTVLLDVPAAPNALRAAAQTVAEDWLSLTRGAHDVPGPRVLRTADGPTRQGVPELPAGDAAWALISGEAGPAAEAAFDAIATELEAPREAGGRCGGASPRPQNPIRSRA